MPFQPLHIIIDEHITLRQYSLEDAEELFELIEKNRHHLGTRLTWLDKYTSLEASNSFVKSSMVIAKTNGAPTCGIWHEGKLVGTVSFHPIDHASHTALLGYWIDADMQGKGVITQATQALIEHGFNNLGIKRVEIVCAPDNRTSQAIALKLGFIPEAETQIAVWTNDPTAEMVVFVKTLPTTDPAA